MLAEMLLYWYAHEGWEAVFVSEDINEAESVWRDNTHQIFYYDDFLGTVRLGQHGLRKNEDQRLSHFIGRVHSKSNKRLLLTTRDYILREALVTYERLDQSSLHIYECVIGMDQYNRLTKARILYNHLYYSPLRQELKASLSAESAYHTIINHRNYTPRFAAIVTNLPEVSDLGPEAFPKFIEGHLEDPTSVWRHAFENQLSDCAQIVLISLATLPERVNVDSLRLCVAAYMSPIVLSAHSFRTALKALDGMYISIFEYQGHQVVQISNPSLYDFLVRYVAADPGILQHILDTTPYFEQLSAMWDLSRPQSATAVSGGAFRWPRRMGANPVVPLPIEPGDILQAMRRMVAAEAAGAPRELTSRLARMVDVGVEAKLSKAWVLISEVQIVIVRNWEDSPWTLSMPAAEVAARIGAQGASVRALLHPLGSSAKRLIAASVEGDDSDVVLQYQHLFQLGASWPETFGSEELKEYRDRFHDHLVVQIEDSVFSDVESLDRRVDIWRDAAQAAGLDIEDDLFDVLSVREDLPLSEGEYDEDFWRDQYYESLRAERDDSAQIDDLFDSLR